MLSPRANLVVLLGLSCCACVTGRTVPIPTAAAECSAIRDRGIFNSETLACFPEAAVAVEDRLCRTAFWTHHEANAAGFGYGSVVYGEILVRPQQLIKGFDRAKVAAWKAEHCRETAERNTSGWSDTLVWWNDVYARLPISLIGPWLECWASVSEGVREEGSVRCYLNGAYDIEGENETVRFTAWNSPDAWLDASAWLTADLEVDGADCGGNEWRAGSRISSTAARVLECRRRGRSAVRVKLVTGEGNCIRSLPELTEPPWRELCQSMSSSMSDTGLPGTTDTSASTGEPCGGIASSV